MLALLRTVAVAQMIQGILEALMGGLVGLLLLVPEDSVIFEDLEDNPFAEDYGGMVAVVAIVILAVGVLRIVAGLQNWDFRGYALGVGTAFAGLVTVFTCYCSVTSVIVVVLALIAYLQTPIREAFALRARGHSAVQVAQWLQGDRGAPPPAPPTL